MQGAYPEPHFANKVTYVKSNHKVIFKNDADIARLYRRLVRKPQYYDVESPDRLNDNFESEEGHLDDSRYHGYWI